MALRLLHDRPYRGANNKLEPIDRFRVLKSGIFSSVQVQASAKAGGWKFAGSLDILTFGDSTRRTSAIVETVSIPLNKEPLLIKLGRVEVRYFAFDPYKSRRAFLNEFRLKIWAEDYVPKVIDDETIATTGIDVDGDGDGDLDVKDGILRIPL